MGALTNPESRANGAEVNDGVCGPMSLQNVIDDRALFGGQRCRRNDAEAVRMSLKRVSGRAFEECLTRRSERSADPEAPANDRVRRDGSLAAKHAAAEASQPEMLEDDDARVGVDLEEPAQSMYCSPKAEQVVHFGHKLPAHVFDASARTRRSCPPFVKQQSDKAGQPWDRFVGCRPWIQQRRALYARASVSRRKPSAIAR